MNDNSKACPDFYNDDAPRNVVMSEDGDLVAQLVYNFVRRQRYEDHIGGLQDVTPNQWRAQVNRAALHMQEEIEAILNTIDEKLHNGDFYDPAKDAVKVER